MTTTARLPTPTFRRLRVYTFDPSLATRLDTSLINVATLKVAWEAIDAGPVGEYLEVVDFDPASDCFYAPADLDQPELLATDGYAPSEGNPQFHQQMVYAVAMTTIRNFEMALGRQAMWSLHFERDDGGHVMRDELGQLVVMPVRRLRIYPHALREANAYYSPEKKALLFGYFPSVLSDPAENLPGGLVFTCLSQDVVAHETTHALLDGLHRYYVEPTNPDCLAFHEAFADIVALFQHFAQPEALRDQIAQTRGDLRQQNLLGKLAIQFGQAIGSHGALRDAIGQIDPKTKEWIPQEPDPEEYARTPEPHARGAILVAAFFDAFLSIYRRRIADLLRIATNGTGKLPEGDIHPDLVNRLANEAARTASHFLRMAIRALDYCPPVDITFGEYLRALVTADADVMPYDSHGYRVAVVEGFRRRGIYPRDVRTLSPDALLWDPPSGRLGIDATGGPGRGFFNEMIMDLKTHEQNSADNSHSTTMEFTTWGDRQELMEQSSQARALVWCWLDKQLNDGALGKEVADALGLAPPESSPASVFRAKSGRPSVEVHSVRSARRSLQDGSAMLDLVIDLVQRRRGYLDEARQREVDTEGFDRKQLEADKYKHDFEIRGGCTILIDGITGCARYVIKKPVCSDARLKRQREFLGRAANPTLRATYSPTDPRARTAEPFAMLHRGH